jgi:hypothetical protein
MIPRFRKNLGPWTIRRRRLVTGRTLLMAPPRGLVTIAFLTSFAAGTCPIAAEPPPPVAIDPAPSALSSAPLVPQGGVANPMLVPVRDCEFVWNQLVDTLDDYFRIEREERVRQVGAVLTEGSIDTYPLVGATQLEPWRRDSTDGYERRLATLQSVRRQATVRVTPTRGGYLIHVHVLKEFEDYDRPGRATVGSLIRRHDGSLVRSPRRRRTLPQRSIWYAVGRDVALEQAILTQLYGRLFSPPPSPETQHPGH